MMVSSFEDLLHEYLYIHEPGYANNQEKVENYHHALTGDGITFIAQAGNSWDLKTFEVPLTDLLLWIYHEGKS